MGSAFASSRAFRAVMDRVIAMMDEDPAMGPQLGDADVPQRFEFDGVDLVVNIRAARPGEDDNLHWEWSDHVDWQPTVRMAMSSETANKYFQAKRTRALPSRAGASRPGGTAKAGPG